MGFSDAQILATLSVPVQATGVEETNQAVNSLQSPLEQAARDVYDLSSAFDALQAKEEHHARAAAEAASQVKANAIVIDATNSQVIELADSYGLLERAEDHEAAAAIENATAKRQAAAAADADAQATRRDTAAKNDATRAARDQARAETETANAIRNRTTQMSMGLMAMSNAFQDWQAAGLNGMVNNISGIAMGIGAIARWTPQTSLVVGAVAQIVATIANMYLPAIREIGKEWGFAEQEAKTGIEGIEERIKELKEQKILLRVDTFELTQAEARLKELKEEQQALDKLMKLRSTHQEEASKQTKSAIAETGRSEEIQWKMITAIVKDETDKVRQQYDKKIADSQSHSNFLRAEAAKERHWGPAEVLRRQADREDIKRREMEAEKSKAIDAAKVTGNQSLARWAEDLQAGTNPVAVEQARSKYTEYLDRVGEGELAEKLRKITPAEVKTKAEKAQAKHDADEKKREKKQADQAESFALHEKFENFSMGKDALEKLARETYEAKQQNGRTDQQVFEELKQKLEVMLKGVGIFTDQQIANNEEARKEVTRQINALAKQVDAQGAALANKAKQEQKEELAPILAGRMSGGNVPEALKETYKGHIAAGMNPQDAIAATLKSTENELWGDTLVPNGMDNPEARKQLQHALIPAIKSVVGQVKGEEAAAKRKADRKGDRLDEKSEEKTFQASVENTGIGDFAELMLAQKRQIAEARRSKGLKAQTDEEIVQDVEGLVGDRLHHRYTTDANGRYVPVRNNKGKAIDFNPKMGADTTKENASKIVDQAERNLNEHMANLAGMPVNTIDKFSMVQEGLLQKVQSLHMRYNDLDARASQQAAQLRRMQTGRRGPANWGG